MTFESALLLASVQFFATTVFVKSEPIKAPQHPPVEIERGDDCWDRDHDGIPDANEDSNMDGQVDVSDCEVLSVHYSRIEVISRVAPRQPRDTHLIDDLSCQGRFVIDTAGQVSNFEILPTDPVCPDNFAANITEAAMRWRFRPVRHPDTNDRIPATTVFTFRFCGENSESVGCN